MSSDVRKWMAWGAGLDEAAGWLVEQWERDLEEVVVCLPGSGAGRRLEELLVEGGVDVPPRVVTAGHLPDEVGVRDPGRAHAGGLARRLAWEEAAGSVDLSGLGGGGAAASVGAVARELHGVLAPEDLQFADVAAVLAKSGEAGWTGEAPRWEVLARVQERYRALLEDMDLADPHDARWAALREGRLRPVGHLVLVGVIEMSALQGAAVKAVEKEGGTVTALVFAPDEVGGVAREKAFDSVGCLVASAWQGADPGLGQDQWTVADGPAGQAEAVARVLDGRASGLTANDVTIGVADDEVAPYLARILGDLGTPTRDAAGTPLTDTGPVRLLSAVAAHIDDTGGFASLAALARHPDMERALGDTPADGQEAASDLDAYHAGHLPGAAPGQDEWLAVDDTGFKKRDAAEGGRAQRLGALAASIDDLLGELAEGADPRPLAEWVGPIRRFMEGVYAGRGEMAREAGDPAARECRLALEGTAKLLDALDTVPAPLANAPAAAYTALQLLVEEAGRARPLPPPHMDTAIELMGWLELRLDDAPLLVVTGFNEGRVPKSQRGDAFLPGPLRTALGLPDADHRSARDAYALGSVLASGRNVHMVSGRRDAKGDPLRPSRLAFRTPDPDELVARARKAFPKDGLAMSGGGAGGDGTKGPLAMRPLPRPDVAVPTSVSVTSLGSYLNCPYDFFLERVLGLEEAGDSGHEIDALLFGGFVHTVLEDWGRSGAAADSSKPGAIERSLMAALEARFGQRFGDHPVPAAHLQRAHIAARLRAFASWQAEWRAQGWAIMELEWGPEARVDLGGLALRGRIDRIDVNRSQKAWALLDYKTGEQGSSPEKVHGPRKEDGAWFGFQLPLYSLLAKELHGKVAAELEIDEAVLPAAQLGYINLPRDTRKTGVRLAEWQPEEVEEGIGAAGEVAKEIAAGGYLPRDASDKERARVLGNGTRRDPLRQALVGEGLLGDPGMSGEENGEDDS